MCSNCFRKPGFLIDGCDMSSVENVLIEILDIFIAIDIDFENIIRFDDQLETQQAYDSDMSIVEIQVEDDKNNEFDEYYEKPENLIKYYITDISYLKKLQIKSIIDFFQKI